jgi:DNA-directed RNA polymerase I, II, and III subunit RPABC2
MRLTLPILTKYERAQILGKRVTELMLRPKSEDPIGVAVRELNHGRIPYTIRRYLPNGTYEDWKVTELALEPS